MAKITNPIERQKYTLPTCCENCTFFERAVGVDFEVLGYACRFAGCRIEHDVDKRFECAGFIPRMSPEECKALDLEFEARRLRQADEADKARELEIQANKIRYDIKIDLLYL